MLKAVIEGGSQHPHNYHLSQSASRPSGIPTTHPEGTTRASATSIPRQLFTGKIHKPFTLHSEASNPSIPCRYASARLLVSTPIFLSCCLRANGSLENTSQLKRARAPGASRRRIDVGTSLEIGSGGGSTTTAAHIG